MCITYKSDNNNKKKKKMSRFFFLYLKCISIVTTNSCQDWTKLLFLSLKTSIQSVWFLFYLHCSVLLLVRRHTIMKVTWIRWIFLRVQSVPITPLLHIFCNSLHSTTSILQQCLQKCFSVKYFSFRFVIKLCFDRRSSGEWRMHNWLLQASINNGRRTVQSESWLTFPGFLRVFVKLLLITFTAQLLS